MPDEAPRAIVIGVQLPEVGDGDFESSLRELERLAKTLGLNVVGRVTQRRSALAPAAVLGEGKLKELAERTGGTGVVPMGPTRKKRKIDVEDEEPEAEPSEPSAEREASIILVDHDLTPSQARNLERATSAQVLDRTSVILSIFQRHARTREARLQVEIARLVYEAPRLRETGAGGDRQRGGIGGTGAGESGLELDRRRIRDRIAELRAELAAIERDAGVRRARRTEVPTVALVGYTNAGKSSWMRVLTGGEAYVADKLFATLDTTVRALVPETRPRILVSDTVGFIKKLPHDLVASFRSTLEEAREASLLIHVVDASDPAFRDQLEVTRAVLHELGADDAPSILLLNKIDRVDEAGRQALRAELPDAMQVSMRDPADVERVHARIVSFFEEGMQDVRLSIPWSKHAVVAAVHESARVLSEVHREDGTELEIRARPEVIARLRAML
ncbi:MAG: GTPase HflX [Sandaracinaceae bacterium]|nr:GTPase HflX [Sandaracinaceae bacterium]